MRRTTLFTFGFCLTLTVRALSFHNDGAGTCESCHSMHNSQDNTAVDPASASGNPYILSQTTPSDVCLGCHAQDEGAVFSQGVLDPAPEKGAGNFVFLLEDNLNDGQGGADSANWIPGDAAGHNLNAPAHRLFSDLTLSSAPGGAFRSEWLGCTSCHDPHGNGNFRMLYGPGPVQGGLHTFTFAAPDADGISLEFGSESNDNHTAYRKGMSEWCANCHVSFHNSTYPSVLKHPSGVAIGASIAAMYNGYNGTSDPAGGSPATAYLALVPFEDADSSNSVSSAKGPNSTSGVMCLSCHRAHASSAPDAGRWDFGVSTMAEDGRVSGSWPIPNPFDVTQRSLCNKCHVRDAGGSLVDATP